MNVQCHFESVPRFALQWCALWLVGAGLSTTGLGLQSQDSQQAIRILKWSEILNRGAVWLVCRPISDLRSCGAFPSDRGGQAAGFLLGAAPKSQQRFHQGCLHRSPWSRDLPGRLPQPVLGLNPAATQSLHTNIVFRASICDSRVCDFPAVCRPVHPSNSSRFHLQSTLIYSEIFYSTARATLRRRSTVPKAEDKSQQLGLQHRDDGVMGPTTSWGVCIRLLGNLARDIANGNTQAQTDHRASRAARQQPAIALRHPPSALTGVKLSGRHTEGVTIGGFDSFCRRCLWLAWQAGSTSRHSGTGWTPEAREPPSNWAGLHSSGRQRCPRSCVAPLWDRERTRPRTDPGKSAEPSAGSRNGCIQQVLPKKEGVCGSCF